MMPGVVSLLEILGKVDAKKIRQIKKCPPKKESEISRDDSFWNCNYQ
jgi:hypothetical protein